MRSWNLNTKWKNKVCITEYHKIAKHTVVKRTKYLPFKFAFPTLLHVVLLQIMCVINALITIRPILLLKYTCIDFFGGLFFVVVLHNACTLHISGFWFLLVFMPINRTSNFFVLSMNWSFTKHNGASHLGVNQVAKKINNRLTWPKMESYLKKIQAAKCIYE